MRVGTASSTRVLCRSRWRWKEQSRILHALQLTESTAVYNTRPPDCERGGFVAAWNALMTFLAALLEMSVKQTDTRSTHSVQTKILASAHASSLIEVITVLLKGGIFVDYSILHEFANSIAEVMTELGEAASSDRPPIETTYRDWVSLNQCLGMKRSDADDVMPWYEIPNVDEHSRRALFSLVKLHDDTNGIGMNLMGRSKIKRLFSGEALCEGFGLDLTLCQIDIEDEFRSGEGSWGRCGRLFIEHPEILPELTVHLAKSVQDVGALRAYLDFTDASTEAANMQGMKTLYIDLLVSVELPRVCAHVIVSLQC